MKFAIGQQFKSKHTDFIREIKVMNNHRNGLQLTLKMVAYTKPDDKKLAQRLIDQQPPLVIFADEFQKLVDKGTYILS